MPDPGNRCSVSTADHDHVIDIGGPEGVDLPLENHPPADRECSLESAIETPGKAANEDSCAGLAHDGAQVTWPCYVIRTSPRIMVDAGIGRLLIASLHQGIADAIRTGCRSTSTGSRRPVFGMESSDWPRSMPS